MAEQQIFTDSHAKSILTTMNNLRKMDKLCDVTLRVDGMSFPAHRIVLAACSDYFSAMFINEVPIFFVCTIIKLNICRMYPFWIVDFLAYLQESLKHLHINIVLGFFDIKLKQNFYQIWILDKIWTILQHCVIKLNNTGTGSLISNNKKKFPHCINFCFTAIISSYLYIVIIWITLSTFDCYCILLLHPFIII